MSAPFCIELSETEAFALRDMGFPHLLDAGVVNFAELPEIGDARRPVRGRARMVAVADEVR